MKHRHLNHQELTLAAIDDLIVRGNRQDWAELRFAALHDRMATAWLWRRYYASVRRAQRIHMPNDSIFGNSIPKETLPDWERVLASAAHLQRVLPEAVLVGEAHQRCTLSTEFPQTRIMF